MDKFSNIFYNLYKSNGIFKQAINLVRRIIGKFTLILFRGIFSLAVAARIVKVLYAEAFKYFDTLYLGNDFTSKIEQILDKKTLKKETKKPKPLSWILVYFNSPNFFKTNLLTSLNFGNSYKTNELSSFSHNPFKLFTLFFSVL